MMNILIEVLLVFAIIVSGILIVVLWRWNAVLIDVSDTAKIAKKRAKDFDIWMSQAETTIKEFTDSFKSFLNTFEQLKNIKNKMTTFLEPDSEKVDGSKKSEA